MNGPEKFIYYQKYKPSNLHQVSIYRLLISSCQTNFINIVKLDSNLLMTQNFLILFSPLNILIIWRATFFTFNGLIRSGRLLFLNSGQHNMHAMVYSSVLLARDWSFCFLGTMSMREVTFSRQIRKKGRFSGPKLLFYCLWIEVP